MVYATLSTAYKPGGFRLGGLQDDASTSVNESIVDNEDLLAVEFGYKGIIGDSLSLSAALFYYDYSDLQVELAILNPDTGIVTCLLYTSDAPTNREV